jgi:hypothetical protein
MLGAADMPIGCALNFFGRTTDAGEKIKAGRIPGLFVPEF